MAGYERLSALDTSFLHAERLEYPMHVGSLLVFEGAPFFDEGGRFRIGEIRDLVLSRLHLIPKFRKRLMTTPLAQGRPVWVDDEQFDIRYHVRLTALPKPGSRDQLVALAERVQEHLLDRERPLWELWFVEGLEGGNVAVIQKTHHSMIDGISGVDVATALLDISPDYQAPEVPEWEPESAPSPSELLLTSVYERVTVPAELARSVRSGLRGPRAALDRAGRLARGVASFVDRNAIAPRTSLNTRAGRHRRFATVRVPIDELKRVRGVYGGTLNDVMLTGVADGLGRLLRSRGEEVDELHLRVVVPVSVRDESDHNTLGNKVSAMLVNLPLGITDHEERLAAIHRETKRLKETEQAEGADFVIGLTEQVAPNLIALAAKAVHRQRLVNMICTNVPGPQFPLYMMGAKLLEGYPFVPLTRNLTLVVGIISYNGYVHFGLFADRDACTDLEVLAAGITDAFVEMVKDVDEREHADADEGGPAAS